MMDDPIQNAIIDELRKIILKNYVDYEFIFELMRYRKYEIIEYLSRNGFKDKIKEPLEEFRKCYGSVIMTLPLT